MWPFRKASRFRRVDDLYSVTGQLKVEDLPAIAEAGFTVLVCIRPDGEERAQAAFADLAAAAQNLGLISHHIPVSGLPSPEQVAAMREVLAASEGQILGWCRSGARAETLRRIAGD